MRKSHQGGTLRGAASFLPLSLLFLFVYGLPILFSLSGSFYSLSSDGESQFRGLLWYRFLLSDKAFLLAAGNTLAWTLAETWIVITAAEKAAFFLRSRSKRKVHPGLYLLLLIPWGMPVYTAVPLWRNLLHGGAGSSLIQNFFGWKISLLTNPTAAFVGTLFASAWLTLPGTAFLFYGALRQIPRAVDEAGKMDGASRRTIERKLEGPFLTELRTVMTISIFLKSLKEFSVIYMLTAGGPPTLRGWTESRIVGATTTLEILLHEIFQESGQEGLIMAMAVLMMIFLSLLFFSLRRFKPTESTRLLNHPLPGGLLFLCPLLIASVLLPLSLVSLSLKTGTSFEHGIFSCSLENWTSVFLNPGILRGYGPTLLLALGSMTLVPWICIPGAKYLARKPETTAKSVYLFLEFLSLLGGIHSLIPMFIVIKSLGLTGSFFPLILICTSHAVPVVLISLTAAFRSVPSSFKDAANLAGATPTQYTTKILIPLLLPALFSGSLLGFLNGFNSFLPPLILLSNPEQFPISIRLFEIMGTIGSAKPGWGLFATVSILNLMILSAILYFFKGPLGKTELDQHDGTG